MSRGGKPVEIECAVILRRPMSMLIRTPAIGPDSREVWIPMSQVIEENEEDGFITITRFIAEKEGLE